MEVVDERCGGLDVHQQRVVACVVVSAPGGPPRKAVRTFGTVTDDLERLAAWLAAEGMTHVAMESTGVFWQPVWNVLEAAAAGFVLLPVNARHVTAVPGYRLALSRTWQLADTHSAAGTVPGA